MARPLRLEFPDAYYHVMSRGNECKAIFRAATDYPLFLGVLHDARDRFQVDVVSYCLMTSHLHLLLHRPHANLSQFMKRLLGVYTLRFNRCYRRSGHLFQGRYKALVVEKDSYLLEVSRYIHLNPCRAGLVQVPEAYRWSSMCTFLRKPKSSFLRTELVLDAFLSPHAYRQFVHEGLGRPDDVLRQVQAGVFLGTEAFVERWRDRLRHTLTPGIAHQRELARVPLEQLTPVLTEEPEAGKTGAVLNSAA